LAARGNAPQAVRIVTLQVRRIDPGSCFEIVVGAADQVRMAKASASTALATATASMSDNAGALAGGPTSDETLSPREAESLMPLLHLARPVEIGLARR